MLIAKVLIDIDTNYGKFSQDDIVIANDGTLFFDIHNSRVEIMKSFKGDAISEGIKKITEAEADTYINEANITEVVKMQNELDKLRKENEELKKASKKGKE